MGDVGAQGNATEADKYAPKSALNRVQDVNVISTRCREISITGCIYKCICLGNAFASGHLVVEVAQLARSCGNSGVRRVRGGERV